VRSIGGQQHARFSAAPGYGHNAGDISVYVIPDSDIVTSAVLVHNCGPMDLNFNQIIGEDNATGIVDTAGNREHILAWPGAGANGGNFVRVWMTSEGELGSMWPILGP
jgi:hypothetical protein